MIDRVGQTYGRLTVLERAECPKANVSEQYGKAVWWSCRCACGNVVAVNSNNLSYGATKSCGCIVKNMGRQSMAALNARRWA